MNQYINRKQIKIRHKKKRKEDKKLKEIKNQNLPITKVKKK